MPRENPDTDEMLRLTRAREKARRVMTRKATEAAEAARAFQSADLALHAFEQALKQRMFDAADAQIAPPPAVVTPTAVTVYPVQAPKPPTEGMIRCADCDDEQPAARMANRVVNGVTYKVCSRCVGA